MLKRSSLPFNTFASFSSHGIAEKNINIHSRNLSSLFNVPPGFKGSLVVQAEIPRGGDFMAFGFDSLWMMSGQYLLRVDPKDNSFVEIDLKGSFGGRVRGISIGEGAVWVPDVSSDVIYEVDPNSNKKVNEIPAKMLSSERSIGVGEGAVWVEPCQLMIDPMSAGLEPQLILKIGFIEREKASNLKEWAVRSANSLALLMNVS